MYTNQQDVHTDDRRIVEFERAMIQEHVRSDLERAKGVFRIFKEVRCGTGTVQEVIKNAA